MFSNAFYCGQNAKEKQVIGLRDETRIGLLDRLHPHNTNKKQVVVSGLITARTRGAPRSGERAQ